MRILVTGATGFLGSAIAQALHQRGHEVVACVHDASHAGHIAGMETLPVDYMRDVETRNWMPRVAGMDVVINAVGILRERAGARFAEIHEHAPRALFRACEHARVRRVIQISALGADADATSRYHQTKHAADKALRASPLNWTIVQPSVVFGAHGASTRLFLRLASLPVIPLVGRGEQQLQPIHVDDLAALIVKLVEEGSASRQTVAAVGPGPVSMRAMLAGYRRAMGMGRALLFHMPLILIRFAARMGDFLKSSALSTETLCMLLNGNTAPVAATHNILGKPPRSLREFIEPGDAAVLRRAAVWSWIRPLALVTLASVWLAAGVVSWVFFREQGVSTLTKLGLSPEMALPALIAACGTNVALGVATLLRPGRVVWGTQLLVMALYTLALTWVEPALWADPYGALVKNLPLAVVLMGMMAVDEA
jgi:uncharacterized protein YbjT (DUF2867 family)